MYVIVVGAGALGSRLIEFLVKDSHNVAVIESEEKLAKEATDRFDAMVLHAHIGQGGILEEAGADKADVIVATTDDDSANLMAMFLGNEQGIETLVCVVNDPRHKKLFDRLGVHVLTDPEVIVARHLYSLVKKPGYEELFSVPKGASLFQVTIGEGSTLLGRTLGDAHQEGLVTEGILLASVTRGEEILNPTDQILFEAGDVVTVFSQEPVGSDQINRFTG
jgi:trk system potassium uptake protein TrkA